MPRTVPPDTRGETCGGAHCYSTVLQVCTLYDASQCSTVHSNLSCCAGAVAGMVDRHARVSRAGVGVGDVPGAIGVGMGVVRSVQGGSQGMSLRSDGFTVTSGGSGVLSGHGVHVELARPRGYMTTLTVGASRVPVVTQNVNRKQLNPGIAKNRKCEVMILQQLPDSSSLPVGFDVSSQSKRRSR
ncbi:hypothetical protein Q7C36_004560 [Tachysurus vachellii]|uniref:Uncharacterized protein n=1 Tax=Tachysurus vachellii TaxID=175792 RepID=A0AA88NKF5_TACVA|nr:hypothetical protein Q7C36_004560 [Tachysurus vachellii]